MNAEQSLKRPYSQNDADVDPSELPPYQANAGNEVDQSFQSLTDPETVPGKLSRQDLGLATKTESRLMPRNPQSDCVSIRYVSSILVTFTTCIALHYLTMQSHSPLHQPQVNVVR